MLLVGAGRSPRLRATVLTLDEHERAVVAAMWAFRARSENQAASRFARIAARLDALQAPAQLRALARRSIDDERRHRARCAALAERFGHASLAAELGDSNEAPAPEVAPSRLPNPRRLTYELVAFCCLTESINAALLTHSFAQTSEPDSRAAVREILAATSSAWPTMPSTGSSLPSSRR